MKGPSTRRELEGEDREGWRQQERRDGRACRKRWVV